MSIPNFTVADFGRALQNLLPSGRVWPRDPDAVQSQVFQVLGATPWRNYSRSLDLLVEALPSTTLELLPEWESSLGLPDPCAGAQPTVQKRREQVVVRFTALGGQSIAYFISYAAELGYPVTITEYEPAVAGRLKAGGPCNGPVWAYAWAVQSPTDAANKVLAQAGMLRAGEPLATWGSAVLECELRRIAPAHTVVRFVYGTSGWIWGSSVWGDSFWGSA